MLGGVRNDLAQTLGLCNTGNFFLSNLSFRQLRLVELISSGNRIVVLVCQPQLSGKILQPAFIFFGRHCLVDTRHQLIQTFFTKQTVGCVVTNKLVRNRALDVGYIVVVVNNDKHSAVRHNATTNTVSVNVHTLTH